jgi:hypothetical protein
MNQKDLIKWGVIALGAYLVWKYVQDHGGIEGLLGTTVSAHPTTTGTHPAVTAPPTTGTGTGTNAPPPAPPATPPPPQTIPPAAPLLDMTGLVVIPDVNESFTGTVKINGIPVRLSIITADGRIFDSSGTEITDSLTARGIDVVALRTAFQNAGAGLTGMSGLGRFTPAWLM